MGEVSKIAWTDATFNPWWGCTRVSPGCEHCYAEQLATVRRRLPVWGVDADRKAMSAAYWRAPVKWDRDAARDGVRRRVFCASMADVFEILPDRNVAGWKVQGEARSRLWDLIAATPNLDWLLLTKRPENIDRLAPWDGSGSRIESIVTRPPWPTNVWLGVTAEDRRRAAERLPILLDIPARVRFVSHEPGLEAVDFRPWLSGGVHWVITGGESGPGARPYSIDWARHVVNTCRMFGAAPFVKQLGRHPFDERGQQMHRRDMVHGTITDPKGGDPDEWPADLRVRDCPAVSP